MSLYSKMDFKESQKFQNHFQLNSLYHLYINYLLKKFKTFFGFQPCLALVKVRKNKLRKLRKDTKYKTDFI